MLHIPYVVQREFQTQEREKYSKDLQNAISGLSGLSRKKLSTLFEERLREIEDELKRINADILQDAEDQFILWADAVGANRIPLCLDQASGALEAYFQGKPPLKSVKNRDDIPDSFIVQAIKKLQVEAGIIHVVAGDKKVRGAFDGDPNAVVYEDLAKFIESEQIQTELLELDLLENLDSVQEALKVFEDESGEITAKISSDIGEKLMWRRIVHSSIPDDNNEASISGYYDPEGIELNFDYLTYFGSGEFGVPFELKIEVSATYYIFKSDYYALDVGGEHTPSVSDHNDHYFEAEDTFVINVMGTASITVDWSKFNPDDFSECVDFESIGIDEIEDISLLED